MGGASSTESGAEVTPGQGDIEAGAAGGGGEGGCVCVGERDLAGVFYGGLCSGGPGGDAALGWEGAPVSRGAWKFRAIGKVGGGSRV